MTTLLVIIGYLCLLLGLGFFSSRLFRGRARITSLRVTALVPFFIDERFRYHNDCFCFGGFDRKIIRAGNWNLRTDGIDQWIGACGHFLSHWHSFVGIRKKHGYLTQIQFFRARFESDSIGYVLFPILVLLVVPIY